MPEYSRFYKCDLHMHTPADSNWLDPTVGSVKSTDDDETKKTTARAFVKRCLDVGLEVIGITNHDYLGSKWFIEFLRDAARELAGGKSPLVILPGFEIAANVGVGIHVLALFDEGASIDAVQHVFSNCTSGCAPGEWCTTQNLWDLLKHIQQNQHAKGVLVCAHITTDKGLFDDGVSDWLQAAEFRESELLCVETTKQLTEMPDGLQWILTQAPQCNDEWRRSRRIGYVMSSDCKRLEEDTSQPGNYIGYRHTWIKMSRPSIKALRQAFLDPDSRIRFGDSNPNDKYTYPRILSISVSGTEFLNCGNIDLSPNLNCIIGGRGTGKSTLVDLAREACQALPLQEDKSWGPDLRERLATLGAGKVEVGFAVGETAYRAIQDSEGSSIVDEKGQSQDVQRFFRPRFISQRELDFMAREPERRSLLGVLDEHCGPSLVAQSAESERRLDAVDELDLKIEQTRKDAAGLDSLRTHKANLEARTSVAKDAGPILRKCKLLSQAASDLAELTAESGLVRQAGNVIEACKDVMLAALPSRQDYAPEEAAPLAPLFKIVDLITAAVEDWGESSQGATDAFAQAIDAAMSGPQGNEWQTAVHDAEEEDTKTRATLAEQDIGLEAFDSLQTELGMTEGLLRRAISASETLPDLEAKRVEALRDLHESWASETELRKHTAKRVRESVGVPDMTDTGPLHIAVAGESNVESFLEITAEYLDDQRRLGPQDVQTLADLLMSADGTSGLMQRFCELLRNLRRGTTVEWPSDLGDARKRALLDFFPEPVLRELEKTRVSDYVDIALMRDGQRIELAQASIGQRALVLLLFALAEGNQPIFIDTPEEGLDNYGVYKELVPEFRKLKERRQLVIVTHNANIPVNADAEQVICLDVVNGEASIKKNKEGLALGGLDRAAVELAVVDVMEGTEEAFRQRKDKYGF